MFGRKKAAKAAKRSTEIISQADNGTAAASPAAADLDPALIAVITAAIAAGMGRPSNGIVIRSLRRATSALPAWGSTGRVEQISNGL